MPNDAENIGWALASEGRVSPDSDFYYMLVGWWVSKLNGLAYWFGTISGLIIMSVGLAYALEFINLLMAGDLAKAVAVLMRGFRMKEWMKVFLAFLAITAGIGLALTAWNQAAYYVPEWVLYCVGIVLFTGGLTFFWTRTKFYKG